MNLKYVYCILDSGEQANIAGEGFAGGKLYSITYQQISALVSDVSAIDYNNDNIFLHEEVIERMMSCSTVLPMRFGTVLDGEENVKAMLKQYYQIFRRNFARLRGCVEMGLKVIWPVDLIWQEIAGSDKIPGKQSSITGQTAGAAYLRKKYAEYHRQKALQAKADDFVQEINSRLNQYFTECRLKKMVTEKMVLNGAYLVMQGRVTEFAAKIGEIKRQYPESKFLLSGPWPPYNFIELKEGQDEFSRGK